MSEHEIDVAPGQIVHWLKDDMAAGRRRKLELRATREYLAEPGAPADEDSEVSALSTVGLLEVRPVGVAHPWVLRVRVEDVVGPHLPEDASAPDEPEEIDLDTFFTDFVAPDRGTVFVTLEADDAQAKRGFDRLFAEIVADRHGH